MKPSPPALEPVAQINQRFLIWTTTMLRLMRRWPIEETRELRATLRELMLGVMRSLTRAEQPSSWRWERSDLHDANNELVAVLLWCRIAGRLGYLPSTKATAMATDIHTLRTSLEKQLRIRGSAWREQDREDRARKAAARTPRRRVS